MDEEDQTLDQATAPIVDNDLDPPAETDGRPAALDRLPGASVHDLLETSPQPFANPFDSYDRPTPPKPASPHTKSANPFDAFDAVAQRQQTRTLDALPEFSLLKEAVRARDLTAKIDDAVGRDDLARQARQSAATLDPDGRKAWLDWEAGDAVAQVEQWQNELRAIRDEHGSLEAAPPSANLPGIMDALQKAQSRHAIVSQMQEDAKLGIERTASPQMQAATARAIDEQELRLSYQQDVLDQAVNSPVRDPIAIENAKANVQFERAKLEKLRTVRDAGEQRPAIPGATGTGEFVRQFTVGAFATVPELLGGAAVRVGQDMGPGSGEALEAIGQLTRDFGKQAKRDTPAEASPNLLDLDWQKQSFFTDLKLYLAGKLGQGLGTSATVIGAAAVGGLPAAGATSVGMGVGQMQNAVEEAFAAQGLDIPPDKVAYNVYLLGTGVGLLESVTELWALKGLMGAGKDQAVKSLAASLAKGVAKGAAIEGVTEGLQELLEIHGVADATGRSIDWTEARRRIIEATAAGAIPGAALGGITAKGPQKSGSTQDPPPEPVVAGTPVPAVEADPSAPTAQPEKVAPQAQTPEQAAPASETPAKTPTETKADAPASSDIPRQDATTSTDVATDAAKAAEPTPEEVTAQKTLTGYLDSQGSLAKSDLPALADKLGVTPEELPKLFEKAVADGVLRKTAGGQYRRALPSANATYKMGSPEAARAAIEQAIGEISKALPKGTKVKVIDTVEGLPAKARDQAKAEEAKGGKVDGATVDGDIYLMSKALNPQGLLGHEGWHAVEARGLATPSERKVLAARAAKLPDLFDRPRYESAYAGRANLADLLEEEAAAHMVEARINGDDFGREINGILDRIIQFLERLANALTGKGFQTADDVIEAFLSGEVASRQARQEFMQANDITAMATDGKTMFAFAGERAKTADPVKLGRAKTMDAAGLTREAIWTETGWFKGVDGKWRFEIDDSGSRFTPDTPVKTLSEAMAHGPAFSAYPDMASSPFKRETAVDFRGLRGYNGSYDPAKGFVVHDELGRTGGRSTTLHEMQHFIQEGENFAKGYNPNEAAKDIAQARLREEELRSKTQRWQNAHTDDARVYEARARNGDPEANEVVSASQRWLDKLGAKSDDNPYGITRTEAIAAELGERDGILQRGLKEYNDVYRTSRLDPHDLYKMHAGEVESRTVQKRMDLTPEQRAARPPWLDYDVPEDQQIVRFADGVHVSQTSYSEEPPVSGFPTLRNTTMYAISFKPSDWLKGLTRDMNQPAGADARRGMDGSAGTIIGDNILELGGDVPRAKPVPANDPLVRGLRPDDTMYAIRAFHGSPHDFDRFSLDKIGTGEGAQAYGHGLYFAENEGVAKQYRDQLSSGGPLQASDASAVFDALSEVRPVSGDRVSLLGAMWTREKLQKAIASGDIKSSDFPKEVRDVLAAKRGKMYEVKINAEPDQFLDWDKPLSQQSGHAKAAFYSLLNPDRLPKHVTPEDVYGHLKPAMAMGHVADAIGVHPGSMEAKTGVPKVLSERGIPGIRYLDQGSRTDGQGTYNYVVFDDALIEITAKDGVPMSAKDKSDVMFALRSSGLDPSPEARKARAEEMGFDTENTWYHVTNQDITAFKSRLSKRNTDAEALHLAKLGTWITNRPGLVEDRMMKRVVEEGYIDGAQTLPLYVRQRKDELYDAGTLANLWEEAKAKGFKKDLQEQGYKGIIIRDEEFSSKTPTERETALVAQEAELLNERAAANRAFQDASRAKIDKPLQDALREVEERLASTRQELKAERDSRTATSVVIFDPKDIRSVNAMFDPSKADSPNLMFALRDRLIAGTKEKASRPGPEGLIPEAEATGASRALAETPQTLAQDAWQSKHPYEQADEVAAALKSAYPEHSEFRVTKTGSAAGDSAYVHTPWGDIRLSDHFANPKPGLAWSDYGNNGSSMSPAAFVDQFADKAKEGTFAQQMDRARAERARRESANATRRDAVQQERADFWNYHDMGDATQTARDKFFKAGRENLMFALRDRLGFARQSPELRSMNALVRDLAFDLGITVRRGFKTTQSKIAKSAAKQVGDTLNAFYDPMTGVLRLQKFNDVSGVAEVAGNILKQRHGKAFQTAADRVNQAMKDELYHLNFERTQFPIRENNLAAMREELATIEAQGWMKDSMETQQRGATLRRDIPLREADLEAARAKIAALEVLTKEAPRVPEDMGAWFQTYLMNPQAASIDPFTDVFEAALDIVDPALLGKIEGAQQSVSAYAKANAAEVMTSMIVPSEIPGAWDRLTHDAERFGWKMALGMRLSDLYGAVYANDHPFYLMSLHLLRLHAKNTGNKIDLKAIDHPAKLWRISAQARAWANRDLDKGIRPADSVDHAGPSMMDVLTTALGANRRKAVDTGPGSRYRDFGAYLMARMGVERWTRYEAAKAAGELGQLREPYAVPKSIMITAVQDFEVKYPSFAAAAQMLYAFQRNLLTLQRDKGLISEETYQALQAEKNYVPSLRSFEDEKTGGSGQTAKKGEAAIQDVIKRFRGSQRDVIDPISSIALKVFKTRADIAVNDTIQKLLYLAEQAGPGGGLFAERLDARQAQAVQVDLRQALKNAAKEANLSENDRAALVDLASEMLGSNVTTTMFTQGLLRGGKGEPVVYMREAGKIVPIRLGKMGEGGHASARLGKQVWDLLNTYGETHTNFVLQMMALPAQIIRTMVVSHPSFMLANIIRDAPAAWGYDPQALPIWTQLVGSFDVIRGAEYVERYRSTAGMMGGEATQLFDQFLADHDVETLVRKGYRFASFNSFSNGISFLSDAFSLRNWPDKAFGATMGGIAGFSMAGPVGGVAGAVLGGSIGGKAMAAAGELTETATRSRLWKHAFGRAKAAGLGDVEAAAEAAYWAHAYGDYSRHGLKTDVVRKWVPFLNANLQANDAFFQRLLAKGDYGFEATKYVPGQVALWPLYKAGVLQLPATLTAKQREELAMSAWAWFSTMAVIGSASMVYALMYRDDDRIKMLPENLRANHWNIPLDDLARAIGTELPKEHRGKHFARIPKPFERAIVANTIERLTMEYARGNPRWLEHWLSDIYEVTKPPLMPTALDLPAQLLMNRDSFSGREIVPRQGAGQRMRSEMFDEYTSQFARWLGGTLDLAPQQVDFMIAKLGSTWGRDATRANIPGAPWYDPKAPTQGLDEKFIASRFLYKIGKGTEAEKAFREVMGGEDPLPRIWEKIAVPYNRLDAQAESYKFLKDRLRQDAKAMGRLDSMTASERGYALLEGHWQGSNAKYQQLHPMKRAETVSQLVSQMQKELIGDHSTAGKKGPRQTILDLSPDEKQAARDALTQYKAMEVYNALVLTGEKGWQNRGYLPAKGVLDELATGVPEIAAEFQRRLEKAHVLPFEGVRTIWPRVKEKLESQELLRRIKDKDTIGLGALLAAEYGEARFP